MNNGFLLKMVGASIVSLKWCVDSNRKFPRSSLAFNILTLIVLCWDPQGLIGSVIPAVEASLAPTPGPSTSTVVPMHNEPSAVKHTSNNDNSTSLPTEQRTSYKGSGINKPWSFWGRISGGDSDDDDESDTEIDDDTTATDDSNATTVKTYKEIENVSDNKNYRPISIKTPVTVEIETVIHRASDIDQSVMKDTISPSLKSSRIDDKKTIEQSTTRSLWPPINPVDWSAIETDAEMDDSASINELDWDKVEDIVDSNISKDIVSNVDPLSTMHSDQPNDVSKSIHSTEIQNRSPESHKSKEIVDNIQNVVSDDATIIDDLQRFSRRQYKRQQHKFQQTQMLRLLVRQLASSKTTTLSAATRLKLHAMMNGSQRLNLTEFWQELKSQSEESQQQQQRGTNHVSEQSDNWLLSIKNLLQSEYDDETDDEGSSIIPVNWKSGESDIDTAYQRARSSNRVGQQSLESKPTIFKTGSETSSYGYNGNNVPSLSSDQYRQPHLNRQPWSRHRTEGLIDPYQTSNHFSSEYFYPHPYRYSNEYTAGRPQNNTFDSPYAQNISPYASLNTKPYTNHSEQPLFGYESFGPYPPTTLNYHSSYPPVVSSYPNYHVNRQLYGPQNPPLTGDYQGTESQLYHEVDPFNVYTRSRTTTVPPTTSNLRQGYFTKQRNQPLVASSQAAKELQRYHQQNHGLAQNSFSLETFSPMRDVVPHSFQESKSIANVPQTFAEASVNASIGSLAKISILCFTIALLCYSAVSPRTIPLSEYNLRFFENIRNLALVTIGPAAIFFSISEAEHNTDVNPIINTFFVSFTIGYVVTFCIEILATTSIRLAVLGWLEPTVFRQMIPKVPLCILPWVLQDNNYSPKRITVFVADLIASCVAAPVIEEYSKLLLLQSATNLPRNFNWVTKTTLSKRRKKRKRLMPEPVTRRTGESDIVNANQYVTSMLAASLGLKLFDAGRRIMQYTKVNNSHRGFYAFCRGFFPIQELCGTMTAIGLAKRDLLGIHVPTWKLLLPAVVIHALSNLKGMKPFFKWKSSSPWTEMQLPPPNVADASTLPQLLKRGYAKLMWVVFLSRVIGYCIKNYYMVNRHAMKLATTYAGKHSSFSAEIATSELLKSQRSRI